MGTHLAGSTQRELSNEYQHDRVLIVFKNLCFLVFPTLFCGGEWESSSCKLIGLSLTSIFSGSIIDILFFNSDYFDSILKNCTNRIFSHVPQYFCGKDPKILTMQWQWRFSQHFLIEYLSFSSKFLLALARNGKKWRKRLKNVFRLNDKTIDIIFVLINWKNYFDRSIHVISMTVLQIEWNSHLGCFRIYICLRVFFWSLERRIEWG